MTKLTVKERAHLQRQKRRDTLIEIVKEQYEVFNKSRLAIGNALIELRDDEHWKDTHTTFKEFCEDTFKIQESYVYKLIKGAQTVNQLPPRLQLKITNEAQTRALAQIPESDRAKVIRAAEKNGGITAENIAAQHEKFQQNGHAQNCPIGQSSDPVKSGSGSVSNSKNGNTQQPPKLELILDNVGTPVTKEAMPYWDRRDEVQNLLAYLSKIKCAISNAKEKDDPLYARVTNGILMDLEPVREHLKEAMPYAICTTCAGNPSTQPTGCYFCTNRGVISQHQWNAMVPKEIKALRLKQNEEIAKTL